MANECTLICETQLPIQFGCADATGIEKGAILKLLDNFSGSLSDGTADLVGGIVQSEKIASDGTSSVSVYRGGIFKGYASGSIAVGDPLGTAADANYPNYIKSIKTTAGLSGSRILGIALESATAGNQFFFELRPTAVTWL